MLGPLSFVIVGILLVLTGWKRPPAKGKRSLPSLEVWNLFPVNDNRVTKFAEATPTGVPKAVLPCLTNFKAANWKELMEDFRKQMAEKWRWTHRSNQFGGSRSHTNAVGADFPTWGIANYMRPSSLGVYFIVNVWYSKHETRDFIRCYSFGL